MTDQATQSRPVKLAEAAFKTMAVHGVPPTPRNYALWYAYFAGGAASVTRAIDEVLAKNQPFTDELNAELYERCLGGGDDRRDMLEAGGRLHAIIGQVRRYIDDHSGTIDNFGHTLDSFTSAMGGSQPAHKVRALIADLIQETQLMAERNDALESRMGAIVGEVSELRENLEAVQREALTDALTGIPNRKFFDARLQEAAREAIRDNEPMSLLIGDIDHFKRFNDTYGHPIGDQVLKLVARTLFDSVKGRDTPARFGGEEFAIVLPRTALKSAQILADQIRNAVMRRKFVGKDTGEDYGGVTISFGAAQYRPDEPAAELIRRADAALYHAKREGRNRVATELQVVDEIAKAS